MKEKIFKNILASDPRPAPAGLRFGVHKSSDSEKNRRTFGLTIWRGSSPTTLHLKDVTHYTLQARNKNTARTFRAVSVFAVILLLCQKLLNNLADKEEALLCA